MANHFAISKPSMMFCVTAHFLFIIQQDFAVNPKMIMQQWQAGKLTHAGCLRDLVRSRGHGMLGAVATVKFVEQQERKLQYDTEISHVQNALVGHLTAFRSHAAIDDWMLQYGSRAYGRIHRFKVLLLRGGSRSGKTQKAKSLFGHTHTLVVNCQGLGNAIPSLQDFDRSVHKCIIFDECQQEQVLSNKALFQAGADKVALGQSACNAHRYEVWCYQTALVCCSNRFHMTLDEGLDCAEDEDWLKQNVECIELPDGVKWFFDRSSSASMLMTGHLDLLRL